MIYGFSFLSIDFSGLVLKFTVWKLHILMTNCSFKYFSIKMVRDCQYSNVNDNNKKGEREWKIFCQSCKSENLISFQIAGEEIFRTDQVNDAISHQMSKSGVLNLFYMVAHFAWKKKCNDIQNWES